MTTFGAVVARTPRTAVTEADSEPFLPLALHYPFPESRPQSHFRVALMQQLPDNVINHPTPRPREGTIPRCMRFALNVVTRWARTGG